MNMEEKLSRVANRPSSAHALFAHAPSTTKLSLKSAGEPLHDKNYDALMATHRAGTEGAGNLLASLGLLNYLQWL